MAKFFGFLAVLLGILAAYLSFWPVQIDPVAWTPPEDAGKTGPFAANDALTSLTRIAEGQGIGPEDTTIGPGGWLYTDYADGRIVRINPVEGAEAADTFIENLPAHPDNLSRAPDGTFWIALVAPRSADLDGLMPTPFWRTVLMRLPEAMRGGLIQPFGWIIAANEAGEVIGNLQDPNGHFGTITSVNEYGGFSTWAVLLKKQLAAFQHRETSALSPLVVLLAQQHFLQGL